METMASVLLVDDEPEVLVSLQSDLAVAGFQSRVAWTGAEATELVRQRPFDAAIIDAVLPDGNGADLIPVFKALRPEMACILVTAAPSRELSLRALAAGALAYVVKPFRPEQITRLVRERRRDTLSPSRGALDVVVTECRGYPLLKLTGDLDRLTAPRLEQRIEELIAAGHVHILLDASGLGFCDSSGLRVLVGTRRRLVARGGDLALVGVGGLLQRVLELARARGLLSIFSTAAEAIDSFTTGQGG